MKMSGLTRAVRNPQRTFLRVFGVLVMNYEKPHYNKALYDFCRKYVNFYNNDETGDRHTNGQWRWLAEYMRSKPRVIFDIGGFNGEYSRKILEADPGVELHVFEPDPQSFAEKLQPALKGFVNVRLVSKGMSDKEGKAELFTSEKYPATNSIHHRGGLTYKVDGKVAIELTTVDAYCAANKIEHIDLLKIDTEGNDFLVLRGAEEMLRAGRVGTIVFEFNILYTYSHIYFLDFAEYLSRFGYVVSKIMPRGTVRVVQPELERTQDAYFVATREDGPSQGK